jgi:hypothetical protein
MLTTAYAGIFWVRYDLQDKKVAYIYTLLALVEVFIAISIRIAVRYCMRRRKNSTSPDGGDDDVGDVIRNESLQELDNAHGVEP